MTDDSPIACSLSPSDLQRRLDEIAAVGAAHLLAHYTEGGHHLLRFRGSEATRQRLEAIIEAEAQCCSFLHLSLEDRGDALILALDAPQDAQPVADAFIAALLGEGGTGRA